MKIYVLPVMFCADHKSKIPYLLTSKDNDETLPLIEVENPKFFHKEIIHQLKHFFIKDSIKVDSECNYNFLDIQNQLATDYINEKYDFIDEQDLFITYGGIILKYRCTDKYQWSEYSLKTQHNGYSADTNLNLLLDYVIQRTSL